MMDAGDPADDVVTMLRASLRGFLAQHWSIDAGRTADPTAVAAMWQRLIGQGVGILGSDPAEAGLAAVVAAMDELGRAACPSPMLATALANLVLSECGDDAALALLAAAQDGRARLAWSFGPHDPDRNACELQLDQGHAIGVLRFVDVAASCTHLLVMVGDSLVVIPLDMSGVTMTATRAIGAQGLYEIACDHVPVTSIHIDSDRRDALPMQAKLALTARAYGAARRAFEMAVDYAKERKQFGQPIGRFQAIQHKLADGLIALESVRLAVCTAARLHDRGDKNWRHHAACAAAFGGEALRRVALETQHTFGAIGYADEHEAPIHFKRVHLDTVALGGAAEARRQIADNLFAQGGAPLPQTDLGPDGNAFRESVQQWLEINWSGARKAAFDALPFSKREFDTSFARDIGKTCWIALGWPQVFGGQARTPLEQLAFMETMERFEAPRIGAAIQSNALMMFGTPEQQAAYLPDILRGEAMHGMGYSEPQAGSDLAALRTSAVRDGDHFVINGQKIWTTTWWGKYMFLAARTEKAATPPHAGISMFIVPMDAEGITIRPATTMYDGTFANIFYDNVRVPLDSLVGELNGGWKVLTGALAFERGLVGGGIVLKVAHAFEQLRCHVLSGAHGTPLADDPLIRDRMARLASEIEIGRQLMLQCAELAANGMTPPEYGAISKVFSGELMERFGEAALDILGMRAMLSEQMPGAIDNGRFEQNLRHALMWVISIGTNEIQRSLIAQRGLGLPR